MIDAQGRTVNYLRLSLTTECNLRCRYCLPEGQLIKHDSLTLDDYAFVVKAAAALGVNRVRLTGGEPLLVKGLADFCAVVRNTPGINDLAITTNGHGLANQADRLYQAGVGRVNISLDSLRPDRYSYLTRGGTLATVLAGIDAALKTPMYPVKINCVVMGGLNDDELMDFALLTARAPLSVRFIELMPFGEASLWDNSYFVPVKKMKEQLAQLFLEPAEILGGGPAEIFRIPGGLGTIGFISGASQHFCTNCNRLRVTAEGLVRPCLFSDAEYSLAPAIVARDMDWAIDIIRTAVTLKPHRNEVLCSKRMAEIGG